MANLQAVSRANNGSLPMSVGTGPVAGAVPSQGVLLTPAGEIAATTTGPAVEGSGGLLFDADGRLFIGAVFSQFTAGALPISADGALVTATVDATDFYQGLPYANALGTALAEGAAVVLGAFSDGFSDGFDV